MQFIDLKQQYDQYRLQIDQRINAVLTHGQYILGPEVGELESKLAAYVGVKHCVCVSSGTDALLLALMALEIQPGDEVITSAFTFIATGEAIALLGAKPVFVDIDEKTYNINPALIEAAITDRTRAIMPVSLYGQCADFNKINKIADKYHLPVIEDAAQSFGASYHGDKSCGLSLMGCTSFFPSKPLGCYGDGGAVFTHDDALADKIRILHVHGQDKRYHHARIGINGRLDTLQAAILLAKLEFFDAEIQSRNIVGDRYDRSLPTDKVVVPFVSEHNVSVYGQYTIRVANRARVQQGLKDLDIPTAVHYPIPLYKQPALFQQGTILAGSEQASDSVLSLPMHPYLTEVEQDRVIEGVNTVCNELM